NIPSYSITRPLSSPMNPIMHGFYWSNNVICFPLLNDRNQSAADHQGSTATGQRKRTPGKRQSQTQIF
ncbi:hypothetical protein, partial [Acidithiobacillus ferriphilus]|uniref:hypothetical protein n=1 Tax=Acidithiobacillus ferriphilus TaxID=1689834 RepID=UPI0040578077